MRKTSFLLVVGMVLVGLWGEARSQNVPELIYYKFNESGGSTTQNFGSAPVGTNPAPLFGQTMGGTGQFGTALIGTGATSTRVETGWTTNLAAGPWTISMWLNDLPTNTTLYYMFGDVTAASFRCFIGGVAGAGNLLLRGGGGVDILVTGVSPGPIVVTFTYDGAGTLKQFKNGVLSGTHTSTYNINGTGATPFRVGGYSTLAGLPPSGLMDEFRVYNRALSDSEVALTWNQPLPLGTPGWSAQTSGIATALYSVKAVSPQVAWAAGAGGVVLRTTNGGNTWTSVGGGAIGTADLYAITAIDANVAFATTSTTTTYLYRTTNGGTTWTEVFSQAGGFLNAIHMFDANNGIAQGDPVGGTWTIIRTTDGGATWARIATEPTQVGGEYGANNGMMVRGTSHIWFTPGTGNGFYRSTDGGTTWSRVALPASGFTAGIHFSDNLYGAVGNSGGAAARTTDGGATWSAVTVGTAGPIYGMGGAGTVDMWATRGTTIQTSNNRGATWTQDFSDATAGTFYHTNFVTSAGNAFGWAVTSLGKIFAYFNPVNVHDMGVTSLTVVPPASDGPANTQRAAVPSLADAADPSANVSDEAQVGFTIEPIVDFVAPDTVRFRAITQNFGTFTEPAYQLGWQINAVNQTPINAGPIAPGARDTLFFQWNNAGFGTHTIRAWTTLSGDSNPANDTASTTVVISPNSGIWTSLPASPNALSRSCVAYIKIADTGYVYQFGGGAGAQLQSVARFNTVTNTWSTAGLASMLFAVSAGTAIAVDDSNIIVFGGESTAGLGKTQKYNVYTNTWSPLADMPTPVTDAAVVQYNDSLVYVIAGGNGIFGTVVFSNVQLYNIRTNSYVAATSYPLAVSMIGVGIFKDTIIVAGGWNGTTGNPSSYKGIVNPANPTQITWTLVAPYPLGGVTRMASTTLYKNNGVGALFAGGAINGATLTAKAYLWNFCTSSWSALDTFALPRSNMKAAGDGASTAYVVGGFTTVGVGTADKFTLTAIEGNCNQQVAFFDNFEAYTVGQQLACQNPTNWTTWSLTPCNVTEDPLISSNQAFSGTKSVVIVQNNDLVKPLSNDTTGIHVATFKFYIPTGKAGYFNTLGTFSPPTFNWAMQVYFDAGGGGRIFAGSSTAGTFTYTYNTWHTAQVVANLNVDTGKFYINNTLIRSWRWTAGTFGGGGPRRMHANNFYGATANDEMYVDDYQYNTVTVGVGEEEEEVLPVAFALSQNYPNPFNPSTTIRYALPSSASISLTVYNVLGQRVATLRAEVQNAGSYDVVWNSRNDLGIQVASGVYFYRLDAKPIDGGAPFTEIKKMLLLK